MVKNSPANTGDSDSVPGSGRTPGGGNGNPLQCSCLKKIPQTEKPGRLRSMGSQRVRQDVATGHTFPEAWSQMPTQRGFVTESVLQLCKLYVLSYVFNGDKKKKCKNALFSLKHISELQF